MSEKLQTTMQMTVNCPVCGQGLWIEREDEERGVAIGVCKDRKCDGYQRCYEWPIPLIHVHQVDG